jgi:hypothetical protein
MNPAKVDRNSLLKLTDLPNIGQAMAKDLRLLGIHQPAQLAGMDPRKMYERLCAVTGVRQDPCVLDVFMSIVCFMNGGAARPWWAFTLERKQLLRGRDHARPVPRIAEACSSNTR